MNSTEEILKKYWGFDSFRPSQLEIIDSLISGNDTLAILSTGGGKSICYQVPGIIRNGITLVISPLIALMQDQVNDLEKRGIKTALITSALSYREIDICLDNVKFGNTQFLYLSPERLKSDLFIERVKQMNVGLIVVDEAHCISEWGHDFRPAYKEIGNLRAILPQVPIAALTASATEKVKDDIVELLKLNAPVKIEGTLNRPNIEYHVRNSKNKIADIQKACTRMNKQTGIVYCATRKNVKKVTQQLRALNINAGMYHGGMKTEDRNYMMNAWMSNQINVMVATNAFGMGIDKSDVRYVLHFDVPASLEAYYQESGRAGRDGGQSFAIAYWQNEDIEIMRNNLSLKYPTLNQIVKIYNAIMNFLQIATGSGKDESYAFDIKKFCDVFKFSLSEVYNTLQILDLNQTISFNQVDFLPTKMKFSVGNSAVYRFQVAHDKYSKLITLLARSYPGIYDQYISIHEETLATKLNMSKPQLRTLLEGLTKLGVIEINFQSNLPKIYLQHERLPDGYLKVASSIYANRKSNEELKLKSVVEYLSSNNCRSQLLTTYFNSTTEPCGKCDNCKEKKGDFIRISKGETSKLIIELLPSNYDNLWLNTQTQLQGNDLKEELKSLILEEKILFEDGIYKLVNS